MSLFCNTNLISDLHTHTEYQLLLVHDNQNCTYTHKHWPSHTQLVLFFKQTYNSNALTSMHIITHSAYFSTPTHNKKLLQMHTHIVGSISASVRVRVCRRVRVGKADAQ